MPEGSVQGGGVWTNYFLDEYLTEKVDKNCKNENKNKTDHY